MNPEVVRTVHAFVHHEDTGLDDCAFARLEYHRTDGQFGRSAALQYFDVWFFLETQSAVACVCDFYGEGLLHVKFHIAVINLLPIHRNGWGSAATSALIGKKERGDN